jgi:geranylgeranyl reductase family protein
MEKFDLLVSGAGPAGAMAAYWSAKAGLSTLLIEKASLPRQKCCAGGLLGRTDAMLDFPLPDYIIKRKIDSFGVIIDGTRERFKTDRYVASTVDRGDFDAFLVGKAQDRGCEVRTGVPTGIITENDDGIVADVNGSEVHANAAIIAEGAVSQNSNRLFGPRSTGFTATGAMAKFGTTDQLDSSLDFYLFDTPTKNIRFGRYFPINGWMFPHQHGGNIGVAGTGLTQASIKKYLLQIEQEMAANGVRIETEPVTTRPIPFRPRKRLFSKKCLAIGDSAGFANPISGEGMTYAFLSAKLSSDSISRMLNGDQSAMAGYQHRCGDKIFRDLKAASIIGPLSSWIVGVVDTRRFLRVLHNHDKVVQTAINVADGKNDWRGLFLRMVPEFLPLFFSSLPGSEDHDQPIGGEYQADQSHHHGRP